MPPRGAGGAANKRKRTAASPSPGPSTSKRSKATSAQKKSAKASSSAASSSGKGKAKDTDVNPKDPVYEQGKAEDLLKKYDPATLLGIKEDDRLSHASSDEAEGLAAWSAKDEEKWRHTLIKAQDETSDQSFIIDELLRWREHPRRKGVFQYRVAWQTYPIYACTWEPASSFDRITLEEFWARKKGRPDYIPLSGPEEDNISAHNSDTDFASFHHLDKEETKIKMRKMRRAWRQDKCDLRLVKALRREERDHRKRIAMQSNAPVSSSSTSHAPSPTSETAGNQRWVTPPQMPENDTDDDVIEQVNAAISAAASQTGSPQKQRPRPLKSTAVGTTSKKTAPSKQLATLAKSKTLAADKSASSSARGSGSEIVTIVISDSDEDMETGASSGPSKAATPNAKKTTPARATNGKAKSPAKTSAAASAKKAVRRRKGAGSAAPSTDDPSDGDVEDEGEDDDVIVGQQTRAGPQPSASQRAVNRDSDSDFFDRSRTNGQAAGRRQIVIPTRADQSASSQSAFSSAHALSNGIDGAPARMRMGSSSSSPLTSLPPSDSELSVLAAIRIAGVGADERPRKKVRIAENGAPGTSTTSTSAPGSVSSPARSQSTSDAGRRVYEPMPVPGTVPRHHTLSAAEIAEGAKRGQRQTSMLARKKLTEQAIAFKAAEIAELEEEEDEGLWGDAAGTGVSAVISQAVPVVAVRSTAALIPRTADGVPTPGRARPISTSSSAQRPLISSRSGVDAWKSAQAGYQAQRAQREAKEEAERLRLREEKERAKAFHRAKEFVTRPLEKKPRQASTGSPTTGGSAVSPVRTASAGAPSTSTRVVGRGSGSAPANSSASTPPVRGSYRGAHHAPPKIQKIGLTADPISKRKQAAAAQARKVPVARPTTSLADLPTIPRKPPPPPVEQAPEATAGPSSAVVAGPAYTATNDDLADLWGDDDIGQDNLSQPNGNASGPSTSAPAPLTNLVSGAAAQVELFNEIASGWDADEPPAQPAIAPDPTNTWASQAAAQQNAYDDVAAAWGDPEPPTQPAVAPTGLDSLNATDASVHAIPQSGNSWGNQMGLAPPDQRQNTQTSAQWNANGPAGALPQSQHTSATDGNVPVAGSSTINVSTSAAQERERFEELAMGWDADEPPSHPTAPAPPPMSVPAATAQIQSQQSYAQQQQRGSNASNGYQTPATADAWLGSGPGRPSQLGSPQPAGMSNSAIASWQAVIPLGGAPTAATPMMQQQNQPGGATPYPTGAAAGTSQAGAGGLLTETQNQADDEARKRFEELASGWDLDEPPEQVRPAPVPAPAQQQPSWGAQHSTTLSHPYHPPMPQSSSQTSPAQTWNAQTQELPHPSQNTTGASGIAPSTVTDDAERQRFEELAAGWGDEEPPNDSAKAAPAPPPPGPDTQSAPAAQPHIPFGAHNPQAGPSSGVNWDASLAQAWDGPRAPPPRPSFPPRDRNGPAEEGGEGSWDRGRGRRDRFRDQDRRRDYGTRDENWGRGFSNDRDQRNSYGQGGTTRTWGGIEKGGSRRESGGYRPREGERPAWGNPSAYTDQSHAQPRMPSNGANESWNQTTILESGPPDPAVNSSAVNTNPPQVAATTSAVAAPLPAADQAPVDADRQKFEELAAGWDDDLPPSPPRRTGPPVGTAPERQPTDSLLPQSNQPHDSSPATSRIPSGPSQMLQDLAPQAGNDGPGLSFGAAARDNPFSSAAPRNSHRRLSPDPASVPWFTSPGAAFVHPDRMKRGRATELDNLPADTPDLVYDDDNDKDGRPGKKRVAPQFTGTNNAPLKGNRWGRTTTAAAAAHVIPEPGFPSAPANAGVLEVEAHAQPEAGRSVPRAADSAVLELRIDPRGQALPRAYEEYDAVVPTVDARRTAERPTVSAPAPVGSTEAKESADVGQGAPQAEAGATLLPGGMVGEGTLELSEDEEGEVESDDAALEIFGWPAVDDATLGTIDAATGAEDEVAESTPALDSIVLPGQMNGDGDLLEGARLVQDAETTTLAVQADAHDDETDSDPDDNNTLGQIQVSRRRALPDDTSGQAVNFLPEEEESQTVRASSSDPVHTEAEKGGGGENVDGPKKLNLASLDTDDSDCGDEQEGEGGGTARKGDTIATVPVEVGKPAVIALEPASTEAEAQEEGGAEREGEDDDDDALAVEALVF